jgi:CheY-like chemotaxis protein
MNTGKTILLIEDDRIDVKIVQRVLQQLDISNDLIVFDNGEAALSWLESKNEELPGLILLDLQLPRFGGLELLDIIHRDEIMKLIPVVILTTSNHPDDRKESFKRDVSGYILKSIDYPIFVKALSGILRQIQKKDKSPI